MAEIVSANPTAGGPFHWAATLASPRRSAMFAYITGWINLAGQVAITTGVSFGCAQLIAVLVSTNQPDFNPTPGNTLGIYAAILLSQGLLNQYGIGQTLTTLNRFSISLHSLGIGALAIALLAKAPTHQPSSFVFATFYDGTGADGIGWSMRASPAYVAVTGILLSQYTVTGYDSAAHLAEETMDASTNAPRGIIMSVAVSARWVRNYCGQF